MSADELDVDAELLAMAGDGSDDESDSGDAGEIIDDGAPAIHGPRTPSEEPKPSVEKVTEEPPSARRGVAQKVRKRGKKRDRRQEIEDDLENLEDGSPSPAASPHSDAMPDSEADAPAASPEDLDDGPLFPVEGKFLSATDREEIMALPELERESILAERAAEALKRQQDLELQKVLAASQAAASKHKRKAAAADLDGGGPRKSSRAKVEKTGRSALDDYKKIREAKGAERTSRFDAHRGGRRSQSRSSGSARDADGESEVEWAEPSSNSRRDKDEPPAELKDFDRCKIGRSGFAKICFYPKFEETMMGCFARVSIGANRETGQNMYRMTQIKGFTQGKPYQLELPNGKTFLTDQYALVAHGSAEKPWPFSACSDSSLTQSEFERYRETLEKERIRVPKQKWLLQKLDDIHRFLDPKWTDEVLQAKFAKQKEMEKRVDPTNAVNVKRAAIMKRKAEAKEADDEEEIARCEAELTALGGDGNVTANGVTTTSLKTKSSPINTKIAGAQTQQERLALLNQKNRGKNADDVRKALLEERKKLQREREKALAEQKAKTEAAVAEAARKKAEGLLGVPRSDMAELFGEMSDFSRAGTPLSGNGTPRSRRSRQGTPLNGVKKEKSGLGLVLGQKKKVVEDELGGLDFGIDVEI